MNAPDSSMLPDGASGAAPAVAIESVAADRERTEDLK